jgi:hypothetical protein
LGIFHRYPPDAVFRAVRKTQALNASMDGIDEKGVCTMDTHGGPAGSRGGEFPPRPPDAPRQCAVGSLARFSSRGCQSKAPGLTHGRAHGRGFLLGRGTHTVHADEGETTMTQDREFILTCPKCGEQLEVQRTAETKPKPNAIIASCPTHGPIGRLDDVIANAAAKKASEDVEDVLKGSVFEVTKE